MIRLHLGAHKTATTYLQELFALNRGRIAAAGRAYWLLAHIRSTIAFSIWSDAARDGLLGPLRGHALRGAPFNHLRTLLEASNDHVISDENILGPPVDALKGRFYPGAGRRLERLAGMFGDRQVEVFLCLRSYPQFLASLFAESLRHGAYMPAADLVAANGDPGGQWPALIDTVHRALPEARIVVWRYEQFPALKPLVVERLAGVPLAGMQALPSEQVRPSPSARAVAVQLERAGAMPKPRRALSMAMAETEFPPTGAADTFDPWPAEQAARMTAAYERDTALIAALPFVEMLGE